MISRRAFVLGAGAAALVLPQMLVPRRTYFLPPVGGWPSVERYTYYTPHWIELDARSAKEYIGYADERVVSARVAAVHAGSQMAPGDYVLLPVDDYRKALQMWRSDGSHRGMLLSDEKVSGWFTTRASDRLCYNASCGPLV